MLNYNDAKIFLKNNNPNLETLQDYRLYIQSEKIYFLPYNPERTYKTKNTWISIEDFLYNYNNKYSKKEFLNFYEAKKWLKDNYKDTLKSVSFLLHSEHGFIQAPYEEITKEKYEELIKNIKPIFNNNLGQGELNIENCIIGSCPIK